MKFNIKWNSDISRGSININNGNKFGIEKANVLRELAVKLKKID